MLSRRIGPCVRLLCVIAWLAACGTAAASEYHGRVTFGGLPVPGATVTATHADQKYITITDQQGAYSFADLPDGTWTIQIQMTGFAAIQQDVTIAPKQTAAAWALKLLPLDQIKAEIVAASPPPAPATPQPVAQPAKPQAKSAPAVEPVQPEVDQRAADGFLINGSVNNGAASPFGQLAGFGNGRPGGRSLYNGGLGLIVNNSSLDASPFSLTGVSTPKPSFNQLTGVANFGGPLKIPHVLRNGGLFMVQYQWARNGAGATESALVPTLAERGGALPATNALGQPVQIVDPATGQAFPGNVVPVSPQAQQLLKLYPQPNLTGNPRYNYQIPIVSNTHEDAVSGRLSTRIKTKNQLFGSISVRRTRTSNPNLFDFLDRGNSLGVTASVNWTHPFSMHMFQTVGYQFSRSATQATPYWANRENISGEAGITGNNQDPANWGPPALVFSSGVAGLSDGQSSHDRNQTNGVSYSLLWIRGLHTVTFGGDYRRQEFNYDSQQNPRGVFSFTGAATQGTVNGVPASGSDFADFLLGIPDTSSIAFGNADKYLRASAYDAYVSDDWRMLPQFTMSAGLRWDYGSPITELYDRLVNLDVVPGFSAVAPVLASDPVGPLTGQRYPNSLVRPDKHEIEPRVGIAWRPLSGSSMVVRAGYGIYYDSSVYQAIAGQMMQQAPLSKSLSLQNSAACPLTLANGFTSCPVITADNFAIDPNFRIGYAQNWQLAVQRDLPGSLQMSVTYLGTKGTRGMQQILPNTFPAGATDPCPTCPTGFAYILSNGNSTREAGQLQLRRRLHSGFTATATYTFSKSIDDDSQVGGQGAIAAPQVGSPEGGGTRPGIAAQNWLDPRAERSLSSFDQRHVLSTELQYTTGMGLAGGTLLSGWRGLVFKEWTFLTNITAGSGVPETPVYLAAVSGTGMTGTIRPDRTGAPLDVTQGGLFLNPGAFAPPLPGEWGNAGRNSIIGPSQFSLDASVARTFRLKDKLTLDLRVDATNLLNHVTFAGWNTTINNAQFGLPSSANGMRTLDTRLRLRF